MNDNPIDPDEIVEKVDKTRNWIERNASVIIAISSVATALAVRKHAHLSRDQIKKLSRIVEIMDADLTNRVESLKVIERCIDQGRNFEYYPGLGVNVLAKKPSLL